MTFSGHPEPCRGSMDVILNSFRDQVHLGFGFNEFWF